MSTTTTKQKLNVKSFVKAELVKADDVFFEAFQMKNFLNAQGCVVKDNVSFQDDKSATLLKNDDWKSVGKRSRHIDIRCFFFTDEIEQLKVRVEHCLTDRMVVNYLSKPLQEKPFKKFFEKTMGKEPHDCVCEPNLKKRRLNSRSVLSKRSERQKTNDKRARISGVTQIDERSLAKEQGRRSVAVSTKGAQGRQSVMKREPPRQWNGKGTESCSVKNRHTELVTIFSKSKLSDRYFHHCE